MKYVIEHLEPKVYKWCLLEYKHISDIVGRKNLIFTNVKNGKKLLKPLGQVCEKSVNELNLKNACVLDLVPGKTLSRSDKKFSYVILGGILGDHPRRRRTARIKLKAAKRNLGMKQMSTDTAAYVAHNLLNGKKMKDFTFYDGIDIELGPKESVHLPYRYVFEKNEVLLPEGFIEFLKRKRNF